MLERSVLNGRGLWLVPAILALVVACPVTAFAKDGSGSGEAQELAKELSNPVSDLASIPFQFNWENGVGPDNGLRTVLNIQPVVPFKVSDKWNMIERWIMPYVSQPEAFGA